MNTSHVRESYRMAYEYLRLAYENESAEEVGVTPTIQSAIDSFNSRHVPFTGWVNSEHYERWWTRNLEIDPNWGIPF